MATGRQLINQAMRQPMLERGWQPRAAGSFSRPLAEGMTGVVAVNTASEHYSRGRAGAFASIGLRDESVANVVSRLSGHRGHSMQPTFGVVVGYLTPEARFREREVGEDNVDEVAIEMAREVNDFGLPFIERAAQDPEAFLRAYQRFRISGTSSGLCTDVVVFASHGSKAAAEASLDEQAARVAGHAGPWVDDMVPALERARAWLEART